MWRVSALQRHWDITQAIEQVGMYIQVEAEGTAKSSLWGSALTNPTSILEDTGSIPGLAQWVKESSVAMSCGVGGRGGLDPAFLCLRQWL